MPRIPEIVHDHGIHLVGSILWLDPTRSRPMAIVSDAGRVSRAACRKVACTAETRDLVHAMWPRKHFQALVSPCEHPFQLGPLSVQFHHAGHMLGGALVSVDLQGARVLHAPTFEWTEERELDRVIPRKADVLLLGSALGDPNILLPSPVEMRESVREFLHEAQRRDEIPLIASDELAVMREVIQFMADEGHDVRVHPRLYQFLGACGRLGLPSTRGRRGVDSASTGPIAWPLDLLEKGTLPPVERIRTLTLSARAATPEGQVHLAGDVSLPWTRHPDHAALVAFAREVGPDEVIVLEGQDEALTQSLLDLGFQARSLRTGRQIPLWSSPGSPSQ